MRVDRLQGDLQAVRDCLQGGEAGAEAFVRRFRPLVAWTVRGMAARRGRAGADHLEDWIQDVFLALFADGCRKLRQYDPSRCRPASWVVLITRQVVMKAMARLSPVSVPVPETADPALPIPDDLVSQETSARLRRSLAALPEREALCLALLVEQGLSEEAVARIMGLSRHAVRALKAAASARLRAAVDPSEGRP